MLLKTSVPGPAFVRPAAVVSGPLTVVVTTGLTMVNVGVVPPSVTGPLRVTLLVASPPSKFRLPLVTTALAMVCAAAPDSRVVLLAVVKVPVPSGPLVTVLPTVAGTLLAARMSDPPLRFMPVVKVLAVLEKTTAPEPFRAIGPAALTIVAGISKLLVDKPEVIIVGDVLPNTRLPP